MATRHSRAVWEGSVESGTGTVALGSGAFQAPYSYSSRLERGGGSSPEELVAAAHAACFSMGLAYRLERAGFAPIRIETAATVHLEPDGSHMIIPRIELEIEADVPRIDDETFCRFVEDTKLHGPVSRLLSHVAIQVKAGLIPQRPHPVGATGTGCQLS